MKRAILAIALMIGAAILARSLPAQQPGRGGRGGPGGPGGGFAVPPIIAALDANGDGELSAKEIDNAAVALRALDKNKDGKLTRGEYLGAPRGFGQAGTDPTEMVTRMMTYDKNGDGKLSKEELPERIQGLIQRADLNKDGFVDKEELTRLVREQGGRGRGAGMGGPGGFPRREGGREEGAGRGQNRGGRDEAKPGRDE
jgi:Ca2+-binding EF-hand superfamily protein